FVLHRRQWSRPGEGSSQGTVRSTGHHIDAPDGSPRPACHRGYRFALGSELIFPKAICTSGGSKAVFILFTRSKATNCVPCGNLGASRSRNPLSFSPPSVAGR